MKNFVITTGALILILTIMQYQFTINELLRQKANLKYAADEAAATAGLCFEEEAFGEGILRFNQKKACQKANNSIALNLEDVKEEELHCTIDFAGEETKRPKVTVTLRQGKLKAVSEYEYVPYR